MKTTAQQVSQVTSGDDGFADGQTLDGKGSAKLSFAMILFEKGTRKGILGV